MTFTALSAIHPLLSAVTAFNPNYSLHSALSASYTFSLSGDVVGLSLALSTSGINIRKGLLDIPNESGYRAFDVFYYLLTSASTPAEREFLDLKDLSQYALLAKSGTFTPPSFLPAADDAAAAEDFRAALKAIGIKGSLQRGLLSVLAGLLKLGDTTGFLVDREDLEEICGDVGGYLGLEPDVLFRKCSTDDREVLIAGIYEALVDWVIAKANEVIAQDIPSDSDDGSSSGVRSDDTVSLRVVDIPRPALGKAVAMRSVFDDNRGINAEMAEDGIEFPSVGHSVMTELKDAIAHVQTDLGVAEGRTASDHEYELEKRQAVLEKVGVELESDSFLHEVLGGDEGVAVGKRGRFDLPTVLESNRVWYHICVHPTDEAPRSLNTSATPTWSAGAVSRQLRDWRLPEWANRRLKHLDFTADFDVEEFVTRYARLGCLDDRDGVENWIMQRGWSNGDAVVGHERIWMRENAWWEAETMLDLKPEEPPLVDPFAASGDLYETPYQPNPPPVPIADSTSLLGSREDLLNPRQGSMVAPSFTGGPRSIAPSARPPLPGNYGLGTRGDDRNEIAYFNPETGQYTDAEGGEPAQIENKKVGMPRRCWAAFVWAMTFWIPSAVLRVIGRMKRPDVQMAWREKLVLVLIILFLNGFVCFWIIALENVLCPMKNHVWNTKEVGWHATDNDFFVSIHGKVYDITKFWKIQHSDSHVETSTSNMRQFGGQVLDAYFPPPLTQMCKPFVSDQMVQLRNNDTSAAQYTQAKHNCGPMQQPDPSTALNKISWYQDKFQPKIKDYYKGKLVWKKSELPKQANERQRMWATIDKSIYDLTDYFYTSKQMNNLDKYNFLPGQVTDWFKYSPGGDLTDNFHKNSNSKQIQQAKDCLDNVFYVGEVDFRDSARCQVNNYLLLAFTIMICAVILVKFLAALQLGSKRRPVPQDKFVVCLVPAYSEGENSLRKGLDSLTALQYDNKRKLICVICDGMIVGEGGDRPTPKIVLDILGVDPKIDPPALPFLSVGQRAEQLNYGKVYSGLYEYEGNVVPYVVIVKVGKESEQNKSKPGNRGKRDTQLLLFRFLSRVHHRSAMSPLELEMFHQINNIIGVDPELYEYCFMVDADTSVREDSLNRLVAACANDAKIAGICGETSLQNEERSWWTMIQVYEYYISHNLSKAFESLFGSVTCLPGW